MARLFFDGECLPKNPGGVLAYGYILYLDDGRRIDGYGVVDDIKRTNNVAEYHGLLKGVERALQEGVRVVEIYGDSMLVVKQVMGEWVVAEPHLYQLVSRARDMVSKFERYTLKWIPSSNNPAGELSLRAYYEEEVRRLLPRAEGFSMRKAGGLTYIVENRIIEIDSRSGRIKCTCPEYIVKSHYNVMRVKDLQPLCVHIAYMIHSLGIDVSALVGRNIVDIVRRVIRA